MVTLSGTSYRAIHCVADRGNIISGNFVDWTYLEPPCKAIHTGQQKYLSIGWIWQFISGQSYRTAISRKVTEHLLWTWLRIVVKISRKPSVDGQWVALFSVPRLHRWNTAWRRTQLGTPNYMPCISSEY